VRSIEACLAPLRGGDPILPVVSSGQWGGQALETYRRTGSVDLLYLAGGGILAHPDGPAAGARALRTWWDAAVERLSLDQAIRKYPELATSLATFGQLSRGVRGVSP
jgi:ribulose-bisphosphate carboxylase large chain